LAIRLGQAKGTRMTGINFMALADGMMLGDKLNKEDDTYWRKQRQEDIAAQYTERDQASKELDSGYRLDEWRDKRMGVEGNRLVSQANDTIAKAAAAQGKQPWQVLLESPEFIIPGADPALQSHVSAGIRSGIVSTAAMRLREQGDYKNAELLEQKYGMVNKSQADTMLAYTDQATGDKRLIQQFGGVADSDGMVLVGSTKVPRNVALGFTFKPESIPLTLINQQRVNETVAQGLNAQTSGVEAAQRARSVLEFKEVRELIAAGVSLDGVPAHLRGIYTAIKGSPQSGGASLVGSSTGVANTIDSLTSSPTMPAAPAMSAAPAMPSAPAMSAAPTMPAAASAVKASGSPPIESWRPAVQVQGADPMDMSGAKSVPSQNAMASDINHKSSKELSDLRYAITTGQRIPGLSPTQLAVYLKDINDEIASRHKLEAVRYARSIKQ
jgi:hypothetical protein